MASLAKVIQVTSSFLKTQVLGRFWLAKVIQVAYFILKTQLRRATFLIWYYAMFSLVLGIKCSILMASPGMEVVVVKLKPLILSPMRSNRDLLVGGFKELFIWSSDKDQIIGEDFVDLLVIRLSCKIRWPQDHATSLLPRHPNTSSEGVLTVYFCWFETTTIYRDRDLTEKKKPVRAQLSHPPKNGVSFRPKKHHHSPTKISSKKKNLAAHRLGL